MNVSWRGPVLLLHEAGFLDAPTKAGMVSTRRTAASPARRRPSDVKASVKSPAKNDASKRTLWSRYSTALFERPFAMHMVQSALIAAAGNAAAGVVTGDGLSPGALYEQVVLTLAFVAPIVAVWLRWLNKMQLHWLLSTVLDQFVFGPVFNIGIFWFISAAFKGGVVLSLPSLDALGSADAHLDVTLTLRRAAFPSWRSYDPVWACQLKAYWLWLPATLLRETCVPPHLRGVFVNVVAFFWAIVFAMILATNRG